MQTSKAEIKAGLAFIQAIAETIREVGEAPAGVVYAALAGKLSLPQFDRVIEILVKAKLVERQRSHLLKWVGPELEKAEPATSSLPG